MKKTKSFQDLILWQKAHKCVLDTYILTKNFPKEELFGITTQLRRAMISIAANVAEGYKRRTGNDKARFFNIAQASLEECRYYLILSNDLKLANCEKLMNNLDEVSNLLEKYWTGAKNL